MIENLRSRFYDLVINLETAKALGLTICRRCWPGQTK
jgi:hypothetical protein